MLVSFLDTAPLHLGGGYERFLFAAARFGSQLGHSVRLVTPSPLLGDIISYATTLQPVGRNLSAASVREQIDEGVLRIVGLRTLRGGLHDGGIIYCKNEPQEILYALAARRRKTPLVVGFHSAVEKSVGRTSRIRNDIYASAAYRALFRAVDAVHVLQQGDLEWVVDHLRFPRSRVAVIGNGTDVQRFRPEPTHPQLPFRILFAGRLLPQKGIDIFLEAVRATAPESEVPLHIVVRGDGTLRPLVERAAAELPALEFLGFSHDLLPEYQRADVVVVPSRWEMFSLVPLEAMSCGVPVIVSDIPAFANLRGTAVSQFPVGDASALALQLQAHALLAAREPEEYERRRSDARNRAVREFDSRLRYAELFRLLAKTVD